MEYMDRKWDEEYEQLLRECQNKGEVATLSGDNEKRVAPRVRVQSGTIWVQMDICFDVLEASISGISFKADRGFKSGELLAITLAKAFKIEAEVMDCQMVESDPQMMEVAYVTRCRFSDEQSAVCFLVLLKEIDSHEITVSAN